MRQFEWSWNNLDRDLDNGRLCSDYKNLPLRSMVQAVGDVNWTSRSVVECVNNPIDSIDEGVEMVD